MALEKAYPGSGTEAIEVVNVDPVTGATVGPGQPSAATVYVLPSAAQTVTLVTADLAVATYRELQLLVNVSAVSGTTPSMTLTLDSKGADGVYYTVYTSSAITAAGKTLAHIGVGAATNVAFGSTVRLTATISGTAPSFTMSASLIGK